VAKKKILIVDDQPDFLSIVKMRLEATGSYEIITANDGQEALDKLKENPDLVLLDIMLPKMDGYEVTLKMKSDPHTKDIPVIMVTSLGELKSTEKAFEAGAIDYVVKPFNLTVLLAKIKKALTK